MNLTAKEKKLLKIFLEDYDRRLSNDGCNDLTKEMRDILTEEEWIEIDRQYHKFNGDPEEHVPGRYSLMNFCVLYYLTKKMFSK
jgi:hypothetical protein